jgi:hypothetical protein
MSATVTCLADHRLQRECILKGLGHTCRRATAVQRQNRIHVGSRARRKLLDAAHHTACRRDIESVQRWRLFLRHVIQLAGQMSC